MPRDFKKYYTVRRFWWLRPAVFLLPVVAILCGIPVFLWIHSYGSSAADWMFAITYVSLAVWLIVLQKQTLFEPYFKQREAVIRKEREAIEQHRREARKAIYAKELELLSAGQTTPVLDVWRLDRSVAARHSFIPGFRACRVDPTSREFQVCIQLDKSLTFEEPVHGERVLASVRTFLRMFINEADVALFTPFADTLIIEILRLIEDNTLTGTPVPCVSISVSIDALRPWCKDIANKTIPGELIFDGGNAITPHRSIPISYGRGGK